MRSRTVAFAILLAAAAASPARAGAPLICHPWVVAEPGKVAPTPSPWLDEKGKLAADAEDRVVAALDRERETLVRMEIVRESLLALEPAARRQALLEKLAARVDAGACGAPTFL